MSHTPGPWFVSGSMTKYVEARIGGGLIQEVAACGPTEADGGYGGQQAANARLIAAAPELLKVVEGIISAHDAHCSDPANCCTNDSFFLSARAAIAKARGEA